MMHGAYSVTNGNVNLLRNKTVMC
jgi:hypothetical protein